MRPKRLTLLVVVGLAIGCGGDYTVPSGGTAPSGGEAGAVDPDQDPSGFQTFWQLLDDTDLKVEVDPAPPAADTEVTLRAHRKADSGFHQPLKSVHYRVVAAQDAATEWLPMPAPTRTELEGGMVKSVYEATIRLPKGTSFVQFLVDHGFGEPVALQDWDVNVE